MATSTSTTDDEYPATATFRAVWTCENPDLPGEAEHVMGDEETDSLDELAENFTAHHHDNCLDCEGYNAHYEGHLDRVEVRVDGDVVEELSADTLVTKYGMSEY